MPSTQEIVRPWFLTEFPGLSICVPGDFIPIPSYENCTRLRPYPKKKKKKPQTFLFYQK